MGLAARERRQLLGELSCCVLPASSSWLRRLLHPGLEGLHVGAGLDATAASASARWRSTSSNSRRHGGQLLVGGARGSSRAASARPRRLASAWESSRDCRPGPGAGPPRPAGAASSALACAAAARATAARAAPPGGDARASTPAPSSTTAPPTLTLPEGHTIASVRRDEAQAAPVAPWAASAASSVVAHDHIAQKRLHGARGVFRVEPARPRARAPAPASPRHRARRRARAARARVVAQQEGPPRPRTSAPASRAARRSRTAPRVVHEQRGHVRAQQRLHQAPRSPAEALHDVGERGEARQQLDVVLDEPRAGLASGRALARSTSSSACDLAPPARDGASRASSRAPRAASRDCTRRAHGAPGPPPRPVTARPARPAGLPRRQRRRRSASLLGALRAPSASSAPWPSITCTWARPWVSASCVLGMLAARAASQLGDQALGVLAKRRQPRAPARRGALPRSR